MTTIKLKNGSGAPTAGDLAQGEPALDLTNKRLYTEDSGGTVIEVGTNPGVDVTFADNRKAVFGADSDLQIYHDGSASYIADTGTGTLNIKASGSIRLRGNDTDELLARFNENGSNQFYYDSSEKLATTNTGIDVTGSVTADGLTVDTSSGITINGTGTSATHEMTRGTGATNGSRPVLKLNVNSSGDAVDGLGPSLQFTLSDTGVTGSELGAIGFIRNGGDGAGMFAVAQDSQSLSTTRQFTVAANGDISFYEDTGTTAKLFWDASEEKLGIGTTSSIDQKLTLVDTADVGIKMLKSGSVTTTIRAVGGAMAFGVDGGSGTTERMRIDSSGTMILQADGAANLGRIQFSSQASTYQILGGNNIGYMGYKTGGYHRFFGSDGAEDMRIDSSGNLLVGTTTINGVGGSSTPEGVVLDGNNAQITVGTSSDVCATFNRQTTDGAIVQFRKDGTTVGSIGTNLSDLTIGTGDTGAKFVDGFDTIVPFNVTTNSESDGVVSIGASANRWKDLYLSGGVYLGGVGAANKLDDYEEGTWTPTVEGASTGGSYTLSGITAKYTKVGNVVTLQAQFGFSAASGGTSYARVHGLPFSYAAGAGVFGTLRADNYNFQAADPVTVIVAATTSVSGNTLNFLEIQDNTTPIDAPVTGISTSTIIGFTITYQTS